MACLDLHYFVTVDTRMQLKDEAKDTHSPLTLSGLRPDDELNATEPSDEESKPKPLSFSIHFSFPPTHPPFPFPRSLPFALPSPPPVFPPHFPSPVPPAPTLNTHTTVDSTPYPFFPSFLLSSTYFYPLSLT